VVKKHVFDFYAIAHFSKPPETRYFLTSGGAKNVFWGIFAYFQTTRNMALKIIFFNFKKG
jgi:hypothetical protein